MAHEEVIGGCRQGIGPREHDRVTAAGGQRRECERIREVEARGQVYVVVAGPSGECPLSDQASGLVAIGTADARGRREGDLDVRR